VFLSTHVLKIPNGCLTNAGQAFFVVADRNPSLRIALLSWETDGFDSQALTFWMGHLLTRQQGHTPQGKDPPRINQDIAAHEE
jgi:hypothetical protein